MESLKQNAFIIQGEDNEQMGTVEEPGREALAGLLIPRLAGFIGILMLLLLLLGTALPF